MIKLINIGYENYVNASRIIAVKKYTSLPTKRDIQNAKKSGTLIDCTEGRKTDTVIYMDNGYIATSGRDTTVIFSRLGGKKDG